MPNDKIKVLRATTKKGLIKKLSSLTGEISRLSYSNIGGHRVTIVFK